MDFKKWVFNNYSIYIILNGFHKRFDDGFERSFQKIINDSYFYEIDLDDDLNIRVEKWVSTSEFTSSSSLITECEIKDWKELKEIVEKLK